MRLPRTLWRSMALEMLRLVGVSAAVLVTLIAFGGAVKPLSDGSLRAGDALKYILLAIPPMLAYALPFAGGFAATLTYHRVASDLEHVAAYAGGVSHRALLAPALGVGLLCAGTLTVLNEEVIPRFLRQMQVMVTADVARLLGQRLERGQSVEAGGMQIYADQIRRIAPEPGSGASDQLLMTRFAAVSVKDGVPVTEATAAVAKLWVLPPEQGEGEREGSRVIVRLEDVVGVSEGRVGARSERLDFAFRGPDLFRDNVKFMSWRELKTLRENPLRLNWVAGRHRALAAMLAERHATQTLELAARGEGAFELVDESGEVVVVGCGRLDADGPAWRLAPASGRDRVEVRTARGAIRTSMEAERAMLRREATPARGPRFRLELERVTAREGEGEPSAPRAVVILDGLAPRADPLAPLLALPPARLLEVARGEARGGDDELERAMHGVREVLARLHNDLMSKRHERFALAGACAASVVVGAVIALALSRRQPLTVYVFTFMPTLAAFATISGGQQVTTKQGTPGLILMWSGVAALLLVAGVLFARIRRH